MRLEGCLASAVAVWFPGPCDRNQYNTAEITLHSFKPLHFHLVHQRCSHFRLTFTLNRFISQLNDITNCGKNNIFLSGSEITFKTVANSNEDMKLYILLLTSGACISSGVVNFKSQPLTCDVRCDVRGAIRRISIKKQRTEMLLIHEAEWRMI